MDTVSAETRSRMMSSVRSVSGVERRAASGAAKIAGCRLRHQPKGVFGRPDFANKARRVAVFVHGCFWHQPCPRRCRSLPKNNMAFWRRKLSRNRERHREAVRGLRSAGWVVWTLWEHDDRIRGFAEV